MITIVDYRTGNLGSIQNMLKKIRADSVVTSNPDEIAKAFKIILPGVGAFDKGMENLIGLGLLEILNKKVIDEKVPVLGICLGMQLMTKKSEEGLHSGLGWFDAKTIRFKFNDSDTYKVPHMGWNFVNQKKESRLFRDIYPDPRFYFVHSFYVQTNDPSDPVTSTTYGIEFTSSFEKGNISGVQFHPEKSHKFGIREEIFSATIKKIKEEGKGKDYDCIIGLSGGVDSSYLAYITVKSGLRPLVVHIDCGWNSELAVKNIENIVKTLNLELHTLVVNWEEMKDLQRSFFKASLPDQDIPQDHAIFAGLYNFASDNKIKYAFNGGNYATEVILPFSWGFQAMDLRHLKAIHKQFGEIKLYDYPTITFFNRFIYFSFQLLPCLF